MKSLNLEQMENLEGGKSAVSWIGGISCGLSLAWPIGTAIFGPTCAGMLLAATLS